MAEFCLDCLNRISKTRYDERKYIISDDLDLCEGCGKWKHVIVKERNGYYESSVTYLLWKLLKKLYWFLKKVKRKK